jgi:hypothetical protein
MRQNPFQAEEVLVENYSGCPLAECTFRFYTALFIQSRFQKVQGRATAAFAAANLPAPRFNVVPKKRSLFLGVEAWG